MVAGRRSDRSSRRGARCAALLALLLPAAVSGCGGGATRPSAVAIGATPAVSRASAGTPARPPSAPEPLSPRARERVERFCSACHPLPRSENFPRDQWPAEVRLGLDLYRASLRTDLPEPPEAEAIRYFQERAPESLAITKAEERIDEPAAVRFQRAEVSGIPLQAGPAIAQVLVTPSSESPAGGATLLTTDMRSGEIRRWRLEGERAACGLLARTGHPCRLTPVPGRSDGWFVGDLGSYMPEDHDRGGVSVLTRGGEAGGDREREGAGMVSPLRTGLSRVVEAIPCDADGRDAPDLLVLEFGWRRTGALRLLLGAGQGGTPTGQQVLDPRHGCLAARVADLDGDGLDDVVAAFAQEHETVDVWYRQGSGGYEHRQIHRLPDPSWGSSGLELADLDGDGDSDILHFNGDTMDSGLARPTHGIRVLWNEGKNAFRPEEIVVMPGVSQVAAADVDRDGDLDLVACALLPSGGGRPSGTFDALLWVEQVPGGWRPHSIEHDACDHAALAVTDVDGDGGPDIVAGTFVSNGSGPPEPLLRVWLNRPAAR